MSRRLGYFEGIRFLSKYLKKHGRNFFLFFLAGVVETVFTVLAPILLAVMVDQMVYFRNIGVFARIGAVFLAMTLFSSVLVFVRYTIHGYLMSMFTFDIKMDVFSKLLDSKAGRLTECKSGEMIQHLIYDSSECMLFMIRNVIHLVNRLLKGSFYLAYVFILDVRVGVAVVAVLPVSALITWRRQRKSRKIAEEERTFYGEYVSWLFEMVKGLGDIKLLRSEGKVRKDFASHQRGIFAVRYGTRLATWFSESVVGLTNLLLLMTVFGLSAYLSFVGQLSIGNVMVLVAFVMIMNEETILYTVHSFLDAQTRLAKMGRIRDFLAADDETEWKGMEELVVAEGRVEFRDVSFAYEEGRAVLDGLSFSIEPGTHFALVGKSGCGKTTIANLLIGLYGIGSGDISIDGKSIYDCSLASIRRSVGIVQQDILLFDATIRENILLGDPKSGDERIRTACERAGILDFVDSLENGLDTVVGKDGILLSGGQKQRVEIARIYLKDPAIIVFDEATSSLDRETERAVHGAWKDVLAGRTAIVISHRESSVMLCDEVLMIEDGKAHVAGDPAELLRGNRAFKTLFAMDGAMA